jgi:ABC-type multidrug transport system fused ATPase/permease subunit
MAAVFRFLLRHWAAHLWLVAFTAGAMILATMTDVFLPIYAGNLVTAVSLAGGDRADALHKALLALAVMAGLGISQTVLRYGVFRGIVRLTLSNMREVARDAFWRVQRFSADWHSNTFAGSVQRKITRGMWALDMLNDTLLVALLPAFAVLAGSAFVLGLRWGLMGALLALGSAAYIILAATLSVRWVAPASQLSNSWDTRVGGALADAITCYAVVKAFGAERREDARLGQVLNKWSNRTSRTWLRGTASGTIQSFALLILRTMVVDGGGQPRRCGNRADGLFHRVRLSTGYRLSHCQSATRRERDGGTGGAAHAANGHRRCAGRAADPYPYRRDQVRAGGFSLRAAYSAFVQPVFAGDSWRGARGAGWPFRFRQNQFREAGAAAA